MPNLHQSTAASPGPRISIVAALSLNGVIGDSGRLPWHIPSDLRRLRALTWGHPIIMGRKTFESLGKPLPGRTNIVVTRQLGYQASKTIVTHSLDQAIAKAREIEDKEIFILGGAQIYALAMPLVDRLYLTIVQIETPGDAFFPPYEDFTAVLSKEHGQDNSYRFQFLTLERESYYSTQMPYKSLKI